MGILIVIEDSSLIIAFQPILLLFVILYFSIPKLVLYVRNDITGI